MKTSLNLMSDHSRRRVLYRRSRRVWSRIIIAVVVPLAVRGIVQWSHYRNERQQQTVAQLDYQPLQKLRDESRQLRKQIQQLQETEQVALALAKEEPVLGLVGLMSRAVVKADDKIYLQQLEIQREPLAFATENRPNLTFVLKGSSIDGIAVTELEETLRELGPFSAVQLKTSQAARLGKITQQSFSLNCTN